MKAVQHGLIVVLTAFIICGCQPKNQVDRDWPKAQLDFQEITVGTGHATTGQAAARVRLRYWTDKFEGKPLGKGERTRILRFAEPGHPKAPLELLMREMKEGGVRRAKACLGDLRGVPGDPMYPQPPLFLELTLERVFPRRTLERLTVREGSGDRRCQVPDRVRLHCQAWSDGFHGEAEFFSSEEPLEIELVEDRVPYGWLHGLSQMRVGEVRQLKLPHDMAFGAPNTETLKEVEWIYFEIELLEFVDEPATPAATPSPAVAPTPSPTPAATASPAIAPTPSPTPAATASPAVAPTPSPTPAATASPTVAPTPSPTPAATASPAVAPTPSPTPAATASPAVAPTPSPTPAATASPAVAPTPSVTPSTAPTATPSP